MASTAAASRLYRCKAPAFIGLLSPYRMYRPCSELRAQACRQVAVQASSLLGTPPTMLNTQRCQAQGISHREDRTFTTLRRRMSLELSQGSEGVHHCPAAVELPERSSQQAYEAVNSC